MTDPNAHQDAPRPKQRQPIAYTIGVPVAVVLFVAMLIGAIIMTRSATPTGGERRTQEQAAVEALRERMPEVFPPDNSQPAGVTVYAQAGLDVTTIRVHGVLNRELQQAVVDKLREARDAGIIGSVVVRFHYPEARPTGLAPDAPGARIPIHVESPEPFREERL